MTEILDRVRQNVIDVPEDTEGRLLGWLQEAQVKAEQKCNWLRGTVSQTYTTTLGSVVLAAAKSAQWIHRVGNPWYWTGSGKAVQMEWLPTIEDFALNFGAGSAVSDRGRPRAIIEDKTALLVYPPPDNQNTLGPLSVAGEYQVVVTYLSRQNTLALTQQTNFLTLDPNIALFLEHYTTAQAMIFNHDPNSATHLVIANAHLRDAKEAWKAGPLNRLKIWPRRDVYGRRRQMRSR